MGSGDARLLAYNFCAAVGVIFVNKAVFAHVHFSFSVALTLLHYAFTLIGLELLAMGGAFERRSSPLTPRLLALAVVVGVAPALNNLSLRFNSLGFYQVAKLLVTPSIVCLDRLWGGRAMSRARAVSLVAICVGVGVACVNDVESNWAGSLAALGWVPVAAVYKALWSRIAKQEGWGALQLMRRVLPISTAVMLPLQPLLDPPGLLHWLRHELTPTGALLIAGSGAAAFCVNWSGFTVLGACSALTHTVLGQLKACLIILGGWQLFGQAYPARSVFGAALALAAMVTYTRANLREQAGSAGGREVDTTTRPGRLDELEQGGKTS